MLKALPFPEWQPDAAPTGETLSIAKNVVPIVNGYSPVGAFQAITSTLGAQCSGGGAFADNNGQYTLLASHSFGLMRYTGSTWTTAYGPFATAQRWNFAQFGENVIYANGQGLGAYDLSSAVAGPLSGAPSNAIDVATVRDFVMSLTDDAQVVWSAFNDSTGWTAGTDQSDFQPLLDGGPAVRIVGGEYAIVLQKNTIRRVSYVGPPVIFQFDVISPEVGCLAPGSVTNVGRLIFFLSERGFEMCDGETVTPIADEKINRWFFAQFSRSDIGNMWAAVDPRRPIVMWAMPGTPGLILCYNWVLKKWSHIETDVTCLFNVLTAATTLEAIDLLYPSGLESINLSLDDPSFAGGNPILIVGDGDNTLGSLSGSNMEAMIRHPNVELTSGRRSRIRNIRPVTDAISASVSVNAKMRAGDAESIVSTSEMRPNGKMPLRSNGRYNDITLTIPAETAWTYVQGCEYEFEAGDGR
jgi:hypothetical protein